MILRGFLILLSWTLVSCTVNEKHENIRRKNVLFIAIDDLRPEIGAYGSLVAKTPYIDQLASDGLLFNKAYCQQAICSPSRASLMTGARPETINVIENFTYFRDENPDIITLPQHFRTNGYQTVSTGKIYHNDTFGDQELSWSRKPAYEKMIIQKSNTPGGYALPENQEYALKSRKDVISKYGKNAPRNGLGKGPAFEKAEVPDYFYEDGYNAELAIKTLEEIVSTNPDQPFFLAMGMKKPHLNWLAPAKYWNMYDQADMRLTSQSNGPLNGAKVGLHPSFELRARYGIPKAGVISDSLALKMKHAYLACVSYVDAQIGKLIEALDKSGQRENTIIILWSDHGWHLGDMGIWGKATNYEIATRVPLIIWTPDMKKEIRGSKSDALVELVDMYPTLAELAGLDLPEHLEGQSFVPLLDNPNQQWKTASFSQFPSPALREWAANPLSQGMRETYFGPLIEEVELKIKTQFKEDWNRDLFENDLMGYAMRTAQYRLIVWQARGEINDEPLFVELYDHNSDPDETVNIAKDKPQLVAELIVQLQKGWKGSLAQVD